ncbi:membrane cofactor protein-like isoform X3 [Patagioenas fasciata]|uniref:membrane cofactor protein-like isoform X3 n=1 Tax=Patagioenas fasciata TaxID=372321 RepID=UPI0032E91ED0
MAAPALRGGRTAHAPGPRAASALPLKRTGSGTERDGTERNGEAGSAGLMGSPPARASGLLLVLLWIGGAWAQDGCLPPDRLQYAEPDENSSKMQSFPIGTEVSYICRPGYMKIPGKSATRTCEDGFQWSPIEQFCTERKCNHPGELAHGFINVTDLTFGSKATFSCQKGFRLRGNAEISCVIKNKGVDWTGDPPFCERIPCEPPRKIANGHYTEAQSYAYQSTVTYTCDEVPKGTDPFSLIGPATIYCTFDTDLNGVWSGPPPECRVVKCDNPKVENGGKQAGFGPSYSYGDSVVFECNPGYFMIGPEVITCQEDNTWSPKPTCEKSACGAPAITHGVVVPVKSGYGAGESVQIRCNADCTFHDGTEEMAVTCQGENTWSSLQDCECGPKSSGFTPVINHGRVIDGQKPSYSEGDFVTIECYAGYTLHGEARIQYTGENRWVPGVPTCQLSAYITAIICVIVAVVVFLAAFWVYKKHCSQNGKRDSTPFTAEYRSCKA